MTAISALRQGFRLAWRSRSVVWILLLANLAVAALAALPIYQGILRSTGHSLMSEALATGFSTDWLTDFKINYPGSLDRYARVILYFALLSLPLNSLLSGGVLGRFLNAGGTYTTGDFFRSTRRYAWRMLWLTAIGLVCYWGIFRLFQVALGHRVELWLQDTIDDRPVFWANLGIAGLTVAGLGFVNLVLDFARVRLVVDDETGVLQAFLASLGFSIARFGRAFIVYVVPILCGIALLGVYRLVVPWSAVNTTGQAGSLQNYREPFVLALLFLGQQLIMFGRYWFRVAAWAGEWSLYAGLRPKPPADEPAAS